MRFNDIIGHKDLKNSLIKTVIDRRVSHAQLFIGERGLEKLQIAIAYSQFIACKNKQFYEDAELIADSCGECVSCKKFNKLIHPDLHFVYPVANTKKVTSKAISKNFISEWREALLESNFYMNAQEWYSKIEIENKQGSISVNEANEIIKTINVKPYESEYKTVIIWMAGKMHHAAAPKLLKSLEEPPDKTLFILITDNPEEIISTIISRTQLVKFHRHSDEVLMKALNSNFDLKPEQISRVISLSDGNYYKSLVHINQSSNDEYNFSTFRDLMQRAYLVDIISMKNLANDISTIGREKIKNLLNYGLRISRLCMLYSIDAKEIIKSDGEELEFVSKLSKFINIKTSEKISSEIESTMYFIERNANAKIALFDMMLRISGIIRSKK
jgi:DNA polymerase-3 subunit delta'